jgi:D-cysteine desulfhydrase
VLAKQELQARDGLEPYVIPGGGTCVLGTTGYVNAALEVAENSAPDVVYVAAGTLGTAVGLALGFAVAGAQTAVTAVRVTPAEICNLDIARDLAEETVAALRALDASFPDLRFDALRFELRGDWFEPGYGVATPETIDAVDAAALDGIKLETTYTGKALAALLADGAAGRLAGQDVLFWDTYSSAAKPAPGRIETLPPVLQTYVEECIRQFGPPR